MKPAAWKALRLGGSMAGVIELIVVCSIVALCAIVLLPEGGRAIQKARMLEMLNMAAGQKTDIAVQLAERGLVLEGAHRRAALTIEDAIGYGRNRRRSLQDLAAGRGEAGPEPRSEASTAQLDALARYQFTRDANLFQATGVLGSRSLVEGMVDFGGLTEQPFAFAVTPAVIADGAPGNLLWLCGQARVPAGWMRVSPPGRTELPGHLLYHLCRDRNPA